MKLKPRTIGMTALDIAFVVFGVAVVLAVVYELVWS